MVKKACKNGKESRGERSGGPPLKFVCSKCGLHAFRKKHLCKPGKSGHS